jgi:hypothetical protein
MNITSTFSNLRISITINILGIINRPLFYVHLKHNILQTGFSPSPGDINLVGSI